MPSLTTPAFDLVKCRRSQRRQLSKLNSKAVVPDAGFCIFQMSAFPLPALSSTSGIILDAIFILFYFFLNNLYPYKTPTFLPSSTPLTPSSLSFSTNKCQPPINPLFFSLLNTPLVILLYPQLRFRRTLIL